MTLWLTISAIGLITFGLRFSFIYLLGRYEVPAWVQRLLNFVPIAVFSALVFPALALPAGTLRLAWPDAHLYARLVAILVAWRTKNVVLTISAGMAALWLLQLWVK
jgi:branched-subunit amino acid transport protein